MKFKASSFHLVFVSFIALVIGGMMFQFIALPALRNDSENPLFVGDSFLYNDRAKNWTIEENVSNEDVGFGSNVWGISTIGRIAYIIYPDSFEHIVFLINLLVFMAMLRNLQVIFRYYEVTSEYSRYLFLLCLNPIVLSSLVALNKEMWGLFFVTSFLRHLLYKNYFRYFFVTLVSFLMRDFYGFAGILFFMMQHLRFKKIHYLIGLSIVAPLVAQNRILGLLNNQTDQSLGFTLMMTKLQSYPGGYFIIYLPRLLLNITDAIVGLRAFDPSVGFRFDYILAMTGSCISFSICCFICVKRWLQQRVLPRKEVLNLFFAYTFLACFSPFVQHRYFFPIWPILLLMVILKPSEEKQQVVPSPNPLVALPIS